MGNENEKKGKNKEKRKRYERETGKDNFRNSIAGGAEALSSLERV